MKTHSLFIDKFIQLFFMSKYIQLNHETEIEGVTISYGHFSNAGNFMGFCVEKSNTHPPLHIYKAQLKIFGWDQRPELPFYALGRWKEIANRPGEFRFTALSIWKSKEDCDEALKLAGNLDQEIIDEIEQKKEI
jgi:hypothetical protein